MDGAEPLEYMLPKGKHVVVNEGDFVKRGDMIIDGNPVLQDILKVMGVEVLARYMVSEIQAVYRLQGVKIDDKHIEVVIRQMLQKVEITNPGDTTFLAGEQVDLRNLDEINVRVVKEGGQPARYEPVLQGITKAAAAKEVLQSIDRLVYYAGWCDKYSALFSSVNPVASSHFNFSVPEPTGVVSVIAPENSGLLGLVSVVAPIICGGNTCVVLASNSLPLSAVTFAEVLATSDLPGGVVNIITGTSKELHSHFSSHMDVNAIVNCRDNKDETKVIAENSSLNVKRSYNWNKDWTKEESQDPYLILDLQEIKTTWHPIENIGIGGAKY